MLLFHIFQKFLPQGLITRNISVSVFPKPEIRMVAISVLLMAEIQVVSNGMTSIPRYMEIFHFVYEIQWGIGTDTIHTHTHLRAGKQTYIHV